jgi:serine/threonine-protein kinase
VVTVHDYGIEAGNRAFLVMELLEGVTLRDELKRCARLDSSRTLAILRGVCLAVEAAHRRQLIHRDLKPENIFLARTPDEPGQTVKVLDFGLSKFLSAHHHEARASATAQTTNVGVETTAGMLVGTFDYMSPEQMRGEHPAVSWDLWAIAVVAYEALTGALPFPGKSFPEVCMAILVYGRAFAPSTPNLSRRAQVPSLESFAPDRRVAPTGLPVFFDAWKTPRGGQSGVHESLSAEGRRRSRSVCMALRYAIATASNCECSSSPDRKAPAPDAAIRRRADPVRR